MSNLPFSYVIQRHPRRKRLAIRVAVDGSVVVRAPMHASIRSIEAMLQENLSWIGEAIARADRRAERAGLSEPFQCTQGETLPLFGRECPIRQADFPHFQAGIFYLSGETREARMEQAVALYENIARKVLPSMTEQLAKKVGVHPNGVKIGRAARSWGYCQKNGTIHYTWRLVCQEEEFVEYVVIHELCHLLYFDHSPAFWAAVERVIPNRKAIEKAEAVRKINLRLAVQGFIPKM